ncbi:hypothetical protein E2C01_049830 [Portunus trituberculatus]|uniref:Uncharacterized protein n=1 Tax=Portunus trituberculatus TaxID=210409 RepID=A0A5B7GEV6_PORTR|nr:hypothetical protein [Portunus trituberculatus]
MERACVLTGNISGARSPDEPSLMISKAPSSSLQTSVSGLAMLQSSLPTASSFPPASEEKPPLMRTCAVETRSSGMERVHPLVLPELQPLDVTPEDFARLQEVSVSWKS